MSTPPATSSPGRLVALLTFLSLTTGLVDAASVLGLDKVFTANMTGNIVFLGFAAVGTPGFYWPFYLTALVTFGLGAALSGRLGKAYMGRSRRRWLVIAAGTEACLLWLAAICAAIAPPAAASGALPVYVLITLTAAAMGSRNSTARRLKVPDLTTTVLTLTITGMAADSRLAGGTGADFGRRARAVAAMFVGAAVGAYLVRRWGLVPPLTLAGVAIIGATLALASDVSPAETGPS